MNQRRIKLNAVLFLVVILLIIILIVCIFDILKSIKSNDQTEIKILDKIEKYEYTVNENDSLYFKKLFEELKETLKEEVDEKKYVEIISQLFITDFYSLDQSLNKNDVGGVQFVYTDYQNDFIKKAKETIYSSVENNIYGKRNQELPSVKEVKIKNIKSSTFEMNNFEDNDAFEVDIEIIYEKDLGYANSVILILVHSNEKIEIAKMTENDFD